MGAQYVVSAFRRTFRRTVILGLALMFSAPVLAQNKDLRLLDAVKRRDQKTVTSLIRAKADLNATRPDGATALAWAVHLGQRSIAEALLDAGAKANTVDEYGETPLTLAAANGDGVLVQRLLKAGAKATSTRWNGETALMIAAGAGSVEAVRHLVLNGADVNAADPRRGQTALMWAAAEGHGDVVSALLEIGANAKAASKTGFTPLVFAITENDVEAIGKLIAAGADPNYTLPSGNKPLLVAMAYRHTEATLTLLERGADVNVKDRGGNAPIHIAAQQGDVAVVKALIARGVDPNVRTPQTMATGRGRGGGGGFRGGPSGLQTPLMLAARGNHEETMRALVAAGADPMLRAQDGTGVLFAAVSGAKLPTVKYAYELDSDINVIATGSGNTLMHAAVGLAGRTQPEVVEVIQFLADHGAKLDELNAAKRTPISLAEPLPVDQAIDRLLKLLAERGEKPKIATKR